MQYLKSCRGWYGITATGLSDGRLCTNISPLNVRLIRQGQPVRVYNYTYRIVQILTGEILIHLTLS